MTYKKQQQLITQYLKCVDKTLYLPRSTPTLALYCDASTDSHGSPGTGARISKTSTTFAESVIIFHSTKNNSNT